MKAFEISYLDGRVLTITAMQVRETPRSLVFSGLDGREWPFSKRNMCCWNEIGEVPATVSFDSHYHKKLALDDRESVVEMKNPGHAVRGGVTVKE